MADNNQYMGMTEDQLIPLLKKDGYGRPDVQIKIRAAIAAHRRSVPGPRSYGPNGAHRVPQASSTTFKPSSVAKQKKIDNLQSSVETPVTPATKAKPKKVSGGLAGLAQATGVDVSDVQSEVSATPKPRQMQVFEPGVKGSPRYAGQINRLLLPWNDPKARGNTYWQGMTEQEWSRKAAAAHDDIRLHPDWSLGDKNAAILGRFPNMDEAEMNAMRSFADIDPITGREGRGHRLPGWSRQHEYAVPHTGAKEQYWRGLFELSGNTDVNHYGSQNLGATDLRIGDTAIDMQDINWNPRYRQPFMSVGALKNASSQDVKQALENVQRHNGTVGDFFDEVQGSSLNVDQGKLLNRTGSGRMDFMAGNVVRQGEARNLLGPKGVAKGSFNPSIGVGEFGVDLREMEENVRRMQLSDFGINDQFGSKSGHKLFTNNGNIVLSLPFEEGQKIGGGKGLIETMVDPDVLESVDEVAMRNGVRTRNPSNPLEATRFHAAMGSQADADKLIKGAVKGRLGGLANVALSGASRETGKRVAKGDYVGAATEFGTNYAIGAAADLGIRKAGQAIMTRLPAALAKGAASSAASGGWAAPMAAAYTAYEIADGAVEGYTGKGISKRMEEASNDAVTSAYERKFNQPAPRGGFVPKDKPVVQEKADRPQLSLENINKAVEATKGLAPEAQAQPAQITQVTPQVDKPDTGNFLKGWVDKARSWFK